MSKERADEIALQIILKQIHKGDIRVYRNVINRPWVFCDLKDQPVIHCSMFDRKFRGWMMVFVWDQQRTILRERELDRILEFLAGRSLRNGISTATDLELLQVIEKEPVVETVVEFMHDKEVHESGMHKLWKSLRTLAKEQGISVRGSKFPGGANVLSRKLSQLKPLLKQLNIEVEIHRSDGCQVKLTNRADCNNEQSSAQSSGNKSLCGNGLGSSDDRNQCLALLQSRSSNPDEIK